MQENSDQRVSSMSAPGHILVVDDNAAFLRIYREIFESEGLLVTTVNSELEAIAELKRDGASFDVVLLDQKLQGGSGPDSGLKLAAEVSRLAPFAKIVIVAGYAMASTIEQALRFGVYDYLVKNGAFEALLRAKVRNAIEATSARRRTALKEPAVVDALRSMWNRVRAEVDRNRKGKLLEELVQLLFQVTPGFGRVTTRLDNSIEEIDIKVDNQSLNAHWKDEGAFLLAECKNWSSKCGAAEVRNFRGKLSKYSKVRTGFLIAPGGFSEKVNDELLAHKEGKLQLILVDGSDLDRWIADDDRLAVLRALRLRAVFNLKTW